jgi:hypothetical protein
MTTIYGRYKERRVNGLIWDRSPSGASIFQTEGAYTPREERMNGLLAHVRENGCEVRLSDELHNRPFCETYSSA